MSENAVLYKSADGVATVTINRPAKKNAVNREVAQGLEDAWRQFEHGGERVAVLTGAAGDFTAGIDIGDAPTTSNWAPNLAVPISKPVIVAAEGWCIGAGMIMLQQADLCIAASSARFRYPEARIGLTRGFAVGLAAKVPHKLAMEILLRGAVLSADDAYRAGLVNRVVEPGQALAVALDWAREIAAADSHAVTYIKAGVDATVPRGAAEHAERVRWLTEQVPANRRLLAGEISIAQLKEV
ncbi:enoyl-CoA hydratase/isomerase family protein [Burkholderia sp. Ac-20353]|uniref:enoyl-CoA hydratase/isomerase family protein n=1 Tax=Burkholderia sp. Ac-20353 TaxID=2703894 RepID=UPI00197B49A1|nr:enoyl-CoA hydratase/isomerase family protein [Burkholderia sp. Ac-20353]MBN3785967.1 enoyl-CoA hydratase/isomerase family protein [Burkholderia sp. Ac-20353]